MSDFPRELSRVPTTIISSYGMDSLGPEVLATAQTGNAAAAWPAANRALYIPFYLDATVTATSMAWRNGATSNGTVYVGIYESDGTQIVTANVAQGTVSVPQELAITSTTLEPGFYFMALMSTSGTATFLRSSMSLNILRCAFVKQEATGGTLPAAATFTSVIGNSYIPLLQLITVANY